MREDRWRYQKCERCGKEWYDIDSPFTGEGYPNNHCKLCKRIICYDCRTLISVGKDVNQSFWYWSHGLPWLYVNVCKQCVGLARLYEKEVMILEKKMLQIDEELRKNYREKSLNQKSHCKET